MRLGLLILLCLMAVTWFEFKVYPGHSYLQGETQLLVPMLERLDTPGFLSRDLVASNPTFAYTIYDEITLALHSGPRLTFAQALEGQQLLFRFGAVLGLFLFARALHVAPLSAVVLSAAVNAITHLGAPNAFVTNPDPTPVAFSFSLVLLASGLLVNGNLLLSSLAAGVALLYDPVTAMPFWMVIVAMSVADRSFRRRMRPAWAVLLVFALILGNLAQLQAGLGSGSDLTARMSTEIIQLTKIRTPWVWVFGWLARDVWSYLFLLVAGVWALIRLGNRVTYMTVWALIGLSLSGLASVVAAALLLRLRWGVATSMQPSRNLALLVALCFVVCGAASFRAARESRWRASVGFGTLLIAGIFNAQVLEVLRLQLDGIRRVDRIDSSVKDLAAWAEQTTWGSSMFQFPDAAKANDPGMFRALSRRSLWADWNSGLIADCSSEAGEEWWSRWESTMEGGYSVERLRRMLPLQIDYYVLRRANALARIKPAYVNTEYVVYDAQDLRESWVGR